MSVVLWSPSLLLRLLLPLLGLSLQLTSPCCHHVMVAAAAVPLCHGCHPHQQSVISLEILESPFLKKIWFLEHLELI